MAEPRYTTFHYDFGSWEECKIEREESFHYQHASDLTHEVLTYGDAAQRRRAQEGFELWLPRVLAYLGPPDTATLHKNRLWRVGLKPAGNDAIRQRWLSKIIPTVKRLGIGVDRGLVRHEQSGEWKFVMPD